MKILKDTQSLHNACISLANETYITVDTEFLRETTYWPKLCLIQVAGETDAYIIDPLAEGLNLKPFFDLMAKPSVMKVFHAGRQDIEIFYKLSGHIPQPIFDTQVAAMVCGFGDSISYDQLVQKVVGAKIDKSHRFTDWSQRPLSDNQLNYALADVTHLRPVYEHLASELEKENRAHWVRQEMDVLTSPSTYILQPEDAWKRLKMRARKPIELAAMQALAAWREEQAQQKDVPRNRIIKDDAIYEIASQRPQNEHSLGKLRTIPKGYERSQAGQDIVRIVNQVLQIDRTDLPKLPKHTRSPEGSSAIVDLLKVLLKHTSEEHNVASKILATSSDLDAIAMDDDADVDAMKGWRRELFGEKALDLKHGKLAIAVKNKRITLIES
jgi:ribonuclease D